MNRQFEAQILTEQASRIREQRNARLRRKIESGEIQGTILANGAVIISERTKGFKPLPTRALIEQITATMDRNEAAHGKRVCHINGKWQLQVRGKDLRRVLKGMKNVRQEGRMLIQA